MGQIPYPEALEVLEGKTVQGHKLVVKRLADLSAAADCQVLFIGASEKPRLSEIMAEVKNRPVLTVAGSRRQAIEHEAAGRARLSISSQLLKLARVVPK